MKFSQKIDLGVKLVDKAFRISFKHLSLFIYFPIYFLILSRIGIEFQHPYQLLLTPPSIQLFLTLLIFNLLAATITYYTYMISINKDASILSCFSRLVHSIISLFLYSLILVLLSFLASYFTQFWVIIVESILYILFFFAVPFIIIKQETIINYLKITYFIWPTILSVSIVLAMAILIIAVVIAFPLSLLSLIPNAKEVIPIEVMAIGKPVSVGILSTLGAIIRTITYLKSKELYHHEA